MSNLGHPLEEQPSTTEDNLLQRCSLRISRSDWDKMRFEVARHAPEEACGLITGEVIGNDYFAKRILATTNSLHSPVRYQIDPQEQLEAFNFMEEQGLDMVGIYHSHPKGPDGPSPTDIAEAYYPEAIHLIWSCRTGEWLAKGYLIREGHVQQVSISVYD